MAKRGIKWVNLDPSKLTAEQRKIWVPYKKAHVENEAKGKELAAMLRRDWDRQYPKGKDGTRVAFKVVSGTMQCGETNFIATAAEYDPGFLEEAGSAQQQANKGQPATEPELPEGFTIRAFMKPKVEPSSLFAKKNRPTKK